MRMSASFEPFALKLMEFFSSRNDELNHEDRNEIDSEEQSIRHIEENDFVNRDEGCEVWSPASCMAYIFEA